jgi:hypothetical protein
MPSGRSSQLMLPPVSRPSRQQLKRKQEVLEEEDYVEALSRIIERDYFPQLAATRAPQPATAGEELSVSEFFERFTSYDNHSFEELQEQSSAEHRRKFHWLYELPESDGAQRQAGMLMIYYLGENVLTGQQRAAMDAILDGAKEERVGDDRPAGLQPAKFRVRNQLMFPPELPVSEDICGMHGTLDGASRDTPGDNRVRSALPQSLLENGSGSVKLLTGGNSANTGDNSLNTVGNNMAALQRAVVRYNKRATLAEQPRSAKAIVRSNTNFSTGTSDGTGTLTAAQLQEWERSTLPRSYPGLGAGMRQGLGLEAPHTPSLRSSDAHSEAGSSSAPSISGGERHPQSYRPVPMSPMVVPGQGALGSMTPLFTWGSVEDSPLLLSMPSPGSGQHYEGALSHALQDREQQRRMKELQAQALREEQEGAPRFTLRPASRREVLAHKLDKKRAGSRSGGGGGGGSSTVPGSVGRGPRSVGTVRASGSETPMSSAASAVASGTGTASQRSSSTASRAQRLAGLTPAARALAEKLGSGHKNSAL